MRIKLILGIVLAAITAVSCIKKPESCISISGELFAPAENRFAFCGEGDQVLWGFGDGSGEEGKVVFHSFTNSGTYQIKQAVYFEKNGREETSSQLVDVYYKRLDSIVFERMPLFSGVAKVKLTIDELAANEIYENVLGGTTIHKFPFTFNSFNLTKKSFNIELRNDITGELLFKESSKKMYEDNTSNPLTLANNNAKIYWTKVK